LLYLTAVYEWSKRLECGIFPPHFQALFYRFFMIAGIGMLQQQALDTFIWSELPGVDFVADFVLDHGGSLNGGFYVNRD
jgi:hypothetical protein